MLVKQGDKVWTAFIWLRTGTGRWSDSVSSILTSQRSQFHSQRNSTVTPVTVCLF